jgi:hypothetical protein
MFGPFPFFFVGRAVRMSLCSPGTGESGARARLASRTSSVAPSLGQFAVIHSAVRLDSTATLMNTMGGKICDG